MTLDPVTLAVIQNGLRQVASEMDLVHEKTSFSPVISEGFDRSNGIYDRTTGEVIAQGELGLPIFVGVMQFTTQAVIERRRDLEPGDVILVNDPYLGGTHLMDVKMVRPFYYRGRLWCYLSNTGHWPDTGGMVPGGFSATATEIVQEGLRLPPVKLVRRGEICQDIIDIVLNNIRVAEERIGDIRAQLGALSVGERRLTQLLDRYGVETVDAAIAELKAGSERLMRAHIDSIPDGTYSATAIVDSDGIVDRPLEVVLDMTVSGSDIHFDLSRSSPPCRGPMNSVWATTQSAVYVAMKHIFPDVPINAGCFAPIHIAPPDGTFLYARYPRPVAGCAAEVAQRIMEAVFGAMGQAIPERLFAAPAGTSGNFGLGGYDPEERPALHHVPVQRRRVRRLVADRRADQRLLERRDLEDPARRDPRTALPDPVRPLRLARRLGGRRAASRRLRGRLPDPAVARRGESLVPDGSRPRRTAGPARRQPRRGQ